MARRLQAIGAVLAVASCTSFACSSDESASPATPNEGGANDGGTTAKGGSSSAAGRGGKGGSGGSDRGGRGGSSGSETGGRDGGDAGTGGEPVDPCPGCASGFCLDDGTCVDCLPSNDQCPAGQYCTDANVCAGGCKDDSSCASGSCGADHSCERCINDGECQGDDVCSSGTCGPACGAAEEGERSSCESGLLCCSEHCEDVRVASNHCGACGAACADGQFCGIDSCPDAGSGGAGGDPSCVACHDVTLANLCAIGKVIVILDTNKNPDEGNREPGRAVGAALEASCQPTPVVTEEEQDSVSALNFTTGRPVSGGGELLLVAGGSFFQNLQGYVEQQGISPLYVTVENGRQQFMRRSDDSLVVRDETDDIESHDFFAVQFMRDAASGSLVLNFQGFWLSGTVAARLFIIDGMLPSLSTFDEAFYVYEWTDANADKLPDLGEIELRASGR